MNKAFDRIAGYEEEKKELSNLAKILKHQDKLIEAGGELPKGILITGELGQGKTTLVEAFIKESGLPSVLITPNNIQGMYDFKGYIESKIKEVKDKSPSIVFFDDINDTEERTSDMLFGPDKNGDSVKQFLGVLDKFKNDKDLFFVFASTGLTSIDEKVVKIMGINKEIELPRPTEYERAEIIKHYLKNKKVSKNVDINELAKLTHNFRCVELEEFVNNSLILSLLNKHESIEYNDFVSTYHDKVLGSKAKINNLSKEEKKRIAYHEAGHAAISLLNEDNRIMCASIISRGSSKGYCLHIPNDNKLQTIDDIKKEVMVCLGGGAAESCCLFGPSAGSVTDYEQAHKLVRDLIRHHGLKGFEYLIPKNDDELRLGVNLEPSEERKKAAEEKEDDLFGELWLDAYGMIMDNPKLMDALVTQLLSKKTLLKDDLDKIYSDYKKNVLLLHVKS